MWGEKDMWTLRDADKSLAAPVSVLFERFEYFHSTLQTLWVPLYDWCCWLSAIHCVMFACTLPRKGIFPSLCLSARAFYLQPRLCFKITPMQFSHLNIQQWLQMSSKATLTFRVVNEVPHCQGVSAMEFVTFLIGWDCDLLVVFWLTGYHLSAKCHWEHGSSSLYCFSLCCFKQNRSVNPTYHYLVIKTHRLMT